MLATVLAFLLQVEPTHGSVTEALIYLARHQGPDGSWGERPEKCTCPANEPVRPCDAETVAPLLEAFRHDDPATRDEAERRLRALGEAALPHLTKGEEDRDPEVRARCAALRHRLDMDPRGGGDVELTSFALLAFLGQGYSHLSRDEVDGFRFGVLVKKALQWLIARQKEGGAFDPKDPVADAIAAFALTEAYGMTAAFSLKDEAQRAIDRVVGWIPTDARGLVWKGSALKSAEISELPFPARAYDSLEAIRGMEGDFAAAGKPLLFMLVHGKKSTPPIAGLHGLNASLRDTETRYVALLAAFQFDGPNGALWKQWQRDLRLTIGSAQHAEAEDCRKGSWDGRGLRGRLRVTAIDALSFEFYR